MRAGVIGSLTELPEMLPAERRVEPEREESGRTTEHERWREFVRATEALDPNHRHRPDQNWNREEIHAFAAPIWPHR